MARRTNGKVTFIQEEDFVRDVAVAQLAVALAQLREGEGTAEEFIAEAIELIRKAHDMFEERK